MAMIRKPDHVAIAIGQNIMTKTFSWKSNRFTIHPLSCTHDTCPGLDIAHCLRSSIIKELDCEAMQLIDNYSKMNLITF